MSIVMITSEKMEELTIPDTKYEMDKYYGVRYKGEIAMYLSSTLAIIHKLTFDDLKQVKKIHRKRLKIFDIMSETSGEYELRKLAERLEEVEFELQEAWGFERDDTKHSWWYKCPRCLCAKMDNFDYYGTNMRSINSNCPVHNWQTSV